MRTVTKFTIVLAAVSALVITPAAVASERDATTGPVKPQQAGPVITINDFIYSPADLAAKVGQPITITNNDGFAHTVTAKDGTFDLDVPANGTVTLNVPKAGSFAYTCTYHPGQHNPATINVS